ncbi:dnaJ homolog subfamily A member 1 [Octopus vulgaris]|uniref:DnaJ homolog subfamily A member 1 n=1 Tax=Octopus vulgaris TaxID=6645 RepID=A0AA36BRR0_OCTVU|nr:dnaJ homolog subfamily A member 1 [Octopus vulgaris]
MHKNYKDIILDVVGKREHAILNFTVEPAYGKTYQAKKILEVHIDKGLKDDQTFRFAGDGDRFPKMEARDVIIDLGEEDDELFRRNGTDLIPSELEKLLPERQFEKFDLNYWLMVEYYDGKKYVKIDLGLLVFYLKRH